MATDPETDQPTQGGLMQPGTVDVDLEKRIDEVRSQFFEVYERGRQAS